MNQYHFLIGIQEVSIIFFAFLMNLGEFYHKQFINKHNFPVPVIECNSVIKVELQLMIIFIIHESVDYFLD